jgi:predicted site-specific integrase-resolvase
MKKTNEACKILGIHPNTLRHWANEGKIKYVRQPSGNRLYDVDDFLNKGRKIDRARIVYARVSSRNQKDDLSSQIRYLRERYPSHELVEDTGSGLNFKRKGFNAILERIMRGEVEEVVVAHKDRLCRFGFDLINSIALRNNCKLVVLDNTQLSPEGELVKDLISIIQIFSYRIYGLRKYSRKVKEDKDLPEIGKQSSV